MFLFRGSCAFSINPHGFRKWNLQCGLWKDYILLCKMYNSYSWLCIFRNHRVCLLVLNYIQRYNTEENILPGNSKPLWCWITIILGIIRKILTVLIFQEFKLYFSSPSSPFYFVFASFVSQYFLTLISLKKNLIVWYIYSVDSFTDPFIDLL